MQQYRDLPNDEFEVFLDVLTNNALQSEASKDKDDEKRMLIADKYRRDIDKVARKEYRKSYNQLVYDEVNPIAKKLWDDKYKSQAESVSAAVSCICAIFPLLTTPAGTSVYLHNSLGRQRVADSGLCGDCDLEVWFPFGNDRIQWVSIPGGTYYANVGGKFLLRKVQPFNRILIGYDTIFWIFGSEANAQTSYRMIP